MAAASATRETRRIGVSLKTSRLTPPKTLESFDFTDPPSLDRGRIMALAQLDFIARAEVVHFLGPPGTGKSHLATALGVAAVKAGRRVYRATLAELIEALGRAEREGRLIEKIRFLGRSSLPSPGLRGRIGGHGPSSTSTRSFGGLRGATGATVRLTLSHHPRWRKCSGGLRGRTAATVPLRSSSSSTPATKRLQ